MGGSAISKIGKNKFTANFLTVANTLTIHWWLKDVEIERMVNNDASSRKRSKHSSKAS